MSAVSPSIVVPGNHDGVHLGHRALLSLAREHGGGTRVVALTFSPHPLAHLRPERAPRAITSIARRVGLLSGAGADEVVVAHFDAAYAAQTAEAWARDRLIRDLGARAIVIGPDYRFGKGRLGTPELLSSLGLEVVTAPPVDLFGERVSSTRIRNALTAGDVGLASDLLGRLHDLTGEVVKGDQRGRTIGFPTANLSLSEPEASGVVPKDGVYAVVGAIEGEPAPLLGVANLGSRPTFAAGRSIEAHFLGIDRDLYGKRLRLGFVERLRDEQKFDGMTSLVAQIRADVGRAEAVLQGADRTRWSWLSSNVFP